jgi:uncharacterized protein
MLKNDVLIVFVKNAVPGAVKTRLAQKIGNNRAYEIYNRLLKITAKEAERASVKRQVWYSDAVAEEDDFPASHFEKFVQSEGDLGERMSHAISMAFNSGNGRAVIIGSDCPDLTSGLIMEAFELLGKHDAVIGPSEDGGYYLLGLSRFSDALFNDISWSTSDVLKQTIQKLEDIGFKYSLLPVLNDIDTAEDLAKSSLSDE